MREIRSSVGEPIETAAIGKQKPLPGWMSPEEIGKLRRYIVRPNTPQYGFSGDPWTARLPCLMEMPDDLGLQFSKHEQLAPEPDFAVVG